MGVMKVIRRFLMEIGQWFSIRHFQGLCVSIIVMVIGVLLTDGCPRMDSRPFYGMVHVGSFAACLGAQLWVILVAGMTMFFILPRHMFGKLQTFLFPTFFLWCLIFSGLSLTTFSRPSPQALDRGYWTQIICLVISFVAASINSVVLAPSIIDSMVKTFQYEVDVGAGHIIGHADIKELKQNPGYVQSYSRFRRCHSGSSLLNVVSLLANFVYLYYLSARLVHPVEVVIVLTPEPRSVSAYKRALANENKALIGGLPDLPPVRALVSKGNARKLSWSPGLAYGTSPKPKVDREKSKQDAWPTEELEKN